MPGSESSRASTSAWSRDRACLGMATQGGQQRAASAERFRLAVPRAHPAEQSQRLDELALRLPGAALLYCGPAEDEERVSLEPWGADPPRKSEGPLEVLPGLGEAAEPREDVAQIPRAV